MSCPPTKGQLRRETLRGWHGPSLFQAGKINFTEEKVHNQIGLLAEYSINSGASWSAASVSGDTSAIASADYDSSLIWQSGNDLGDQEVSNAWFRITPHDGGGWGTADTTYIDIDNLAPQRVTAGGTQGNSTFTFMFSEPVTVSTATNSLNISLSSGLTIDTISVNDSWTTATSMPTARRFPAAAVIDGKMYVAGGNTGSSNLTSTTSLEVYGPTTDSWTAATSMPTARAWAAAATIDRKLYVAGGYNGTSVLKTLEVYDPTTDSWTTATPMPTRRYVAAVAAIDG